MKIRFYLAMMAAALVMTNCSKEEELVQEKKATKSFTATIEGASRSDVTTDGAFSWTAGDEISVWNGSTFDVYANSETDVNTFDAKDQDNAGEAQGYAIYPSGSHSISNEVVSVNLPATYTHGSTNAPMLATIEEGSTNLAFKHLGGLMRFVVKDVPAGASSFVFTATDNIITGNYSVIDGQIRQDGENDANNTNNNVTITFTELTETAEEMVFYVPLPTGTYGEYKVEIKGDNLQSALFHTSEGVTNTIGRRTMLLMPEFSVENGGLKKGTGNVIPVTEGEAEISGNQSVTISAEGADANDVLNLKYTPQEGNAILSLSDGSEETTPQTSVAKVKIEPTTSETTIERLKINAPTLTAELGAGTYGTIEALTANQTLIIGEGVTIKNLVLNGGNVELYGKVENIYCNVNTTIKLMKDIELDRYIYLINRNDAATTFELNNYTLSNQTEGTENIYGILAYDGTLTIKGEGAIDARQTAVYAYGATVNIEGGNYIGGYDGSATILAYTGIINISGGTFEAKEKSTKMKQYSVLNCTDKNYKNHTANIVVTGGSYKNFNPAKNKSEGSNTNFVAEGYQSTTSDNGETYVVTKE